MWHCLLAAEQIVRGARWYELDVGLRLQTLRPRPFVDVSRALLDKAQPGWRDDADRAEVVDPAFTGSIMAAWVVEGHSLKIAAAAAWRWGSMVRGRRVAGYHRWAPGGGCTYVAPYLHAPTFTQAEVCEIAAGVGVDLKTPPRAVRYFLAEADGRIND
jgi:hypothetical protein